MANLFRANKKGSGGIQVESLTITTMPTKTTYAQYDSVDLTGAVITATFPDGVTANVTNAVDISPSILSNTGSQTVTLSYGEATATFNVTVNAMTSIAVTTLPTKTIYQPDEALDLTGIVVTGTAGALTPNITPGCTFNPANGTILDEEKTYTVNVSYHGLTTSFNVTCSSLPASLEDATWAQIQSAARNGTLSLFASEGDTKSFIYNGQTLYAKLVGIGNNDDTLHRNYYPFGTADFITVDCLNTTYQMNSSTSNFKNNGGWKNQPLRTTLNTTIYNALPSDLKAVIIDKVHTYDCGQYSPQSTSGTSWTWQKSYQSLSDKLWLPTLVEVGLSAYDGSNEDSTYNANYSVFTNNNSRKKKVNGSESGWWLSSPFAAASTSDVYRSDCFAFVFSDGSKNFVYTNGAYGVPLCFRIG